MSDYLDINNEELLKDFFSEAEQQVEQLESNILIIENDPTNHDAIDEIFRAAHTLKGGSATVEMMELSGFTHKVEDLLDELRSGNVSVSGDIVDVLLDSIDVIKAMLESRTNGEIYSQDVSDLVSRIESFIPAKQAKKKESVPRPSSLFASASAMVSSVAPSSDKTSNVTALNKTSNAKIEKITSPFEILSTDDLLELNQALERGESLFAVVASFSGDSSKEESVAIFSALKDQMRVLKTEPDYETFLSDEFLSQAVYFVASTKDKDAVFNVVSQLGQQCSICVYSPQDAVAALEDNEHSQMNASNSFVNQQSVSTDTVDNCSTSTNEVSKAQAEVPNPFASLSEYETLELAQLAVDGKSLWCVVVNFDESNPMNTVGGIQVFAALKDKGSVVKTNPDFDSLYEDSFYPQVLYYLVSTSSKDELESAASISDVTLETFAIKAPSQNTIKDEKPSQQGSVDNLSGKKEMSQNSKDVLQTSSFNTSSSVNPVEGQTSIELSSGKMDDESVSSLNKTETPKKTPAVQHSSGSLLRVDSRRIDYLLNLVSETVITKASFNQNSILFGELQSQLQNVEQSYKDKVRKLLEQLPQMAKDINEGSSVKDIKHQISQEYGDVISMFDPFSTSFKSAVAKFKSGSQNLGRIAGELQEGVMKIRMVPISQIFSRFPRVVRDLSRDLHKKVELIIEGEETELDKAVIDDLLDPIMHCVRNSLDHGIESPEVRKSSGKPEEGKVLLKASNEGNLIIIEISDDGGGIDVEAVRKKAVERGVIHPNKELTDMEAYQLIFEPGFSTSSKITSVSGRGVGLDVVKNSIEKINGTVTVHSEHGIGSKFIIKLPLTLAIIQGLLVRVGKEIYSIPIASVIESIRVSVDEINRIDNYEVINVRDEVISLLRLNTLFGIPNKNETTYRHIVIVGTNDKKIGLMVDSLIGEEDVVIKALKDQFTNSPGIAGASILGDGSVSLIIDVSQLLELGLKQEQLAKTAKKASAW